MDALISKLANVRAIAAERLPAVDVATINQAFVTMAAMRTALTRIAELDPEYHSDEGRNEWGEADCFNQAQKLAREALGAG